MEGLRPEWAVKAILVIIITSHDKDIRSRGFYNWIFQIIRSHFIFTFAFDFRFHFRK